MELLLKRYKNLIDIAEVVWGKTLKQLSPNVVMGVTDRRGRIVIPRFPTNLIMTTGSVQAARAFAQESIPYSFTTAYLGDAEVPAEPAVGDNLSAIQLIEGSTKAISLPVGKTQTGATLWRTNVTDSNNIDNNGDPLGGPQIATGYWQWELPDGDWVSITQAAVGVSGGGNAVLLDRWNINPAISKSGQQGMFMYVNLQIN